MSGENQVEDGSEIMVEIVGSDVFLDGFGTNNEKGDSISAVIENSDSQIVVNGEENDTLVSQEVAVSVDEMVDNNSANANRESTEIPYDCVVGEIGGTEVDTDVSTIKDDAMDTDLLNDPVEALAEGEKDVAELVNEEKSEGADNNSDTFLVKVANEDKPSETGEGIDTKRTEELLEFQGTAIIQELDAPTENEAMDDNVNTDQLNDPVEALAEGENDVAELVNEEESEGADNNSDTFLVKDVNEDKPRETGEGIDTKRTEELLEFQGMAIIQELDAPTENVCPSPNDTENQVAGDNSGVNAEIGVDDFVEENRSPPNKELEVSVEKSEAKHGDVVMSENVELATSNDEINKSRESEEDSSKIQELDAPTENLVAEDNPVVNAEIGVDNSAEENRSPPNEESEVSLGKSEGEHGDVVMSENVEVATSNDEMNKSRESEEDFNKSHDNRSSETRLVDVGKETEQHQEYHQEQEVDAETEQLSDEVVSSRKRKALESLTDGPDKRANSHAANISASTDQNPKPSFKIGECILRAASQLTGGTSMVVNEISAESSSVIDMLSQFQIVAQDPSIRHEFQDEIFTFISGFRSSVVATKRARKKRSDKSVGGPAEEFEFDDAKDSYWTDMIVQNSPEKQTLHENENREGRFQLAVPINGEKPEKSGRKPQSRKKRYFTGHIPNTSDEFEEKAKRMKQETSPAELILNFSERKSVPSEINLNKVFRRFGPLMESETEVDYESGRARVIFKRGSDAEVAHSSSQKFNIFGPVLINYQVGYSPLISVKVSPP